jgi:hypothetical protein
VITAAQRRALTIAADHDTVTGSNTESVAFSASKGNRGLSWFKSLMSTMSADRTDEPADRRGCALNHPTTSQESPCPAP